MKIQFEIEETMLDEFFAGAHFADDEDFMMQLLEYAEETYPELYNEPEE